MQPVSLLELVAPLTFDIDLKCRFRWLLALFETSVLILKGARGWQPVLLRPAFRPLARNSVSSWTVANFASSNASAKEMDATPSSPTVVTEEVLE